LSAAEVGVAVIGNNLANLHTPGFKSSATAFYDLMAQSLGGGGSSSQVGIGTGRPETVRQFTQGAIQSSGGVMDAAIQGEGFFIVRDTAGRTLYTRAGNFHLDAGGNLLSMTGEKVQGWAASAGVLNTNGPTGDLIVPVGATSPPVATDQLSLDLNLDAAGVIGQSSGSFSSPIQVVDSLGATHVLTMTFTKSAANTWAYKVSIPGEDLTSGTAGTPSDIAGVTGDLVFDGQGQLTSPDAAGGDLTIDVTGLANGADDLDITWSLYSGQTPRITQFAQASSVSANAQNGVQAAQISKVNLSNSGKLIAEYSNGRQQLVGQIALASIRNPESMAAVGNNNLQPGSETAAAALGPADTGGRGKIMGGSLEASTVDIAHEFTRLIVMQRSYQANARVISVSDELSQETINMTR
jgi:flagellar hook protein FlgE